MFFVLLGLFWKGFCEICAMESFGLSKEVLKTFLGKYIIRNPIFNNLICFIDIISTELHLLSHPYYHGGFLKSCNYFNIEINRNLRYLPIVGIL